MQQLKVVPDWFFRLPKAVQWLAVLAAIAALVWEHTRVRGLHEPQQAFVATLIILAITIALREWVLPKPKFENAKPAGIGDFQFPTATEGRIVPLLWGRVRVRGPNVVWYGDLDQEAVTKKVKVTLFSSTRFISYYKYNLGVQLAVCRGPGVVLKRVWIGEEVVYSGTVAGGSRFDIDETELYAVNPNNDGVQATVDFYSGDDSQPVNTYLNDPSRQQITTAASPTAPRYAGTCYLVLREMTSAAPTVSDNGAYLGNSTSIRPWSFELERYPALFDGQAAGENKIGSIDANPINVIYELLTNTEWGFGFATADIDVGINSSFLSAADEMITEGNGLSMMLDQSTQAKDLMDLISRQIDGVVFLNQRTGKWTIKLARADYDINTVHQLTEDNIVAEESFSRGSWEDTSNQVKVKFTNRVNDYKESYASAQDMANAIISGGGSVTAPLGLLSQPSYPGVMDAGLAAKIAWRDLRAQSYPIARASLKVMRDGWDLSIGDVTAWTSTIHGFTKMPVRITRINYGDLTANTITLTLVQDVYKYLAASSGAPPSTSWQPPSVGLVAYPSTKQLAFEAPRAIMTRDPELVGSTVGNEFTYARVFCAARRQGRELGFRITQRNSAGTPSGNYLDNGDIIGFVKMGELTSALAGGTAIPTTVIQVDPDPDSAASILAVIDNNASLDDLGQDLANLVLVDNEFMLVSSAVLNTGKVDLTNVYRGALDSAQRSHAAGASVFVLTSGAGLADTSFPYTRNVDIQLRAFSTREVYPGSATTITIAIDRRAIRPYPPSCTLYSGGSTAFATPNVDADGSGMNGTGVNIAWRRRSHQNTDEVEEMLADNTLVAASTEYRVVVSVDPDGANTTVFTSSWATGVGPVFLNRLLIWNEAAAGTEIRIELQTRHDVAYGSFSAIDLTSLYQLQHDVVPTSAFTARFYLGGHLNGGTASNAYTAAATGTFTAEIGAAYSTSVVEVSINGGAYATAIAAGLTSGTFSASSADTIRLRHTVSEVPSPQLVQIKNPSAVIVAYGVMTN
jgi:hypothetical protein